MQKIKPQKWKWLLRCADEKNISLAVKGYKIFFSSTSLTLKCKPVAGLKTNRKPVAGLNTKNCQLFSGRGKELKPVENRQMDKEIIRNELGSCEKDSIYITIVLRDSIHALSSDDLELFRSKYSLSKDTTLNSYLLNRYLIPLNNLPARTCFKLKLASQYQPPSDGSLMLLRQLKDISFSRIVFDADKTHGMLTCEYVCGSLCGNGYRIFIKKLHDKWLVDYIEDTWIA